MILTEKQKKALEELRIFYCRKFAEDPQDGSNFDNLVLDVLSDEYILHLLEFRIQMYKNSISDTDIVSAMERQL